jgi:hypothetical protein
VALEVMCEKGHRYIQPDIIVGDLPDGWIACPTCREEAEKENRGKMKTYQIGRRLGGAGVTCKNIKADGYIVDQQMLLLSRGEETIATYAEWVSIELVDEETQDGTE